MNKYTILICVASLAYICSGDDKTPCLCLTNQEGNFCGIRTNTARIEGAFVLSGGCNPSNLYYCNGTAKYSASVKPDCSGLCQIETELNGKDFCPTTDKCICSMKEQGDYCGSRMNEGKIKGFYVLSGGCDPSELYHCIGNENKPATRKPGCGGACQIDHEYNGVDYCTSITTKSTTIDIETITGNSKEMEVFNKQIERMKDDISLIRSNETKKIENYKRFVIRLNNLYNRDQKTVDKNYKEAYDAKGKQMENTYAANEKVLNTYDTCLKLANSQSVQSGSTSTTHHDQLSTSSPLPHSSSTDHDQKTANTTGSNVKVVSKREAKLIAPLIEKNESYDELEQEIKELGDQIDQLILIEETELNKIKGILGQMKAQADKELKGFEDAKKRGDRFNNRSVQYSQIFGENLSPSQSNSQTFDQCYKSLETGTQSSGRMQAPMVSLLFCAVIWMHFRRFNLFLSNI